MAAWIYQVFVAPQRQRGLGARLARLHELAGEGMKATAVSILTLGFGCLAMAQGPAAPNRKVRVARGLEQQFAQTVRPFVESTA